MTNKEKIIWLSGLIDGEGCIYAKVVKNTKTISIQIQVHCASKIMVDAIEQIYLNENISYKREKPFMQPRSTRPTHRITVCKKLDVKHLLQLLQPFLCVKKQEAERVLSYYDSLNDSIKPITFDDKLIFVSELKGLKRI